MRTLVSLLLIITFAVPAFASDGVLEINQTCAVQTGCFSGDTAGFPVTIDGSAGRSYRLTGDLNVGDPDLDGFFINTSRVTLDFNGFSLIGAPIGTGIGVGISGGGTNGSFAGFFTVRNGVIRGFRREGIALSGAKGVRVEDMVVEFNFRAGIRVGELAQVLSNRLSANGSSSNSGIITGNGASIVGNVVSGSGQNNIWCFGSGCTISNNTVSNGGEHGIYATGNLDDIGSTITNNTAFDNAGAGIAAGDGSTVSGNTAHQNGVAGIATGRGATVSNNTAYFNPGAGIDAASESIVEGNTVSRNSAGGLELGPTATYRNNTMNDNSGAPNVNGGVDMGGNSCDGTPSCP